MLKKLAGQTAVYGLSTIIPRLINYLLTPYLTYVALNEEQYGAMGYLYASIPFGLSLLTMGMENAFFKFSSKHTPHKEKLDIFNTTTSFISILSILFLITAIWFQDSIFATISVFATMDKDFAKSIISITAGIIAIDAISSIPFARLREQQHSFRFVTLKALSVIINVLFVVFFYSVLPEIKSYNLFNWMWIDNFGVGYVMLSNLIASGVILIILLFLFQDFKFHINKKTLKTILLFSIPLFISGFSGTANEFIDRQMMLFLLPKETNLMEIGVYTATLKVAGLMVIFTQMYRYAAEPLFLSKMDKNEFKNNNATVVKFFWITSMTIFLFITLFIDIFKYLVDADLRSGMHLVPIFIISNILLGIQLNLSFWYKFINKTHFAIYITLIGLSVNIIFNLLFMETMGYSSAAIAKMLGMFSMVVVSYILNQLYYPIKYDLKRIGEYTLLTAFLYFAGQCIEINSFILDNLVNLALLLSFVLWAMYRENILQKIIRK